MAALNECFTELQTKKSYSPSHLLNITRSTFSSLKEVGVQQDCQEFLTQLIDHLHGVFDEIGYGTPCNPIKDLLYGAFRSEGFNDGGYYDHVEIFNMHSVTIDQCLNLNESIEVTNKLEVSFEKDGAYQQFGKIHYHILPKIFIFHLKRFQFAEGTLECSKLNTLLKFPAEVNLQNYTENGTSYLENKKINVTRLEQQIEFLKNRLTEPLTAMARAKMKVTIEKLKFAIVDINEKIKIMTCKEKDANLATYQLKSIIVHDGISLHNGHYYSFCFNGTGPNRRILECNDNLIAEVTEEEVKRRSYGAQQNEAAYILFYIKSSANPSLETNTTIGRLFSSHKKQDKQEKQIIGIRDRICQHVESLKSINAKVSSIQGQKSEIKVKIIADVKRRLLNITNSAEKTASEMNELVSGSWNLRKKSFIGFFYDVENIQLSCRQFINLHTNLLKKYSHIREVVFEAVGRRDIIHKNMKETCRKLNVPFHEATIAKKDASDMVLSARLAKQCVLHSGYETKILGLITEDKDFHNIMREMKECGFYIINFYYNTTKPYKELCQVSDERIHIAEFLSCPKDSVEITKRKSDDISEPSSKAMKTDNVNTEE